MEEFAFSQGKQLRCGYTTGSCAAAASKAAAEMLLSGERVSLVHLDTPKGVPLELEPQEVLCAPDYVSCAIRKDAGDDPDDTNGVLVYARVEKTAQTEPAPGEVQVQNDGTPVIIAGGEGVGRVTKPGLSCEVGGPAINPVPRKMITEGVQQVAKAHGYTGALKVTISIPEGPRIAANTFNPRLGIVGGLSVLGTSGIVEPMSERALIETMYTEMNARKAAGEQDILVFFGNYGADFTRDELKLDISRAVTCSNFVGELLDYAVFCGFRSLLIIGHSGKLIKLSQGVMNTHSKYADCRTETAALSALFHGASVDVVRELYGCLTTDEVTKVLRREGLEQAVFADISQRIDFYMQKRVYGKLQTGAILFSNVYGVLAQTEHAAELLALQQERSAQALAGTSA